jgi:hypothetical protein
MKNEKKKKQENEERKFEKLKNEEKKIRKKENRGEKKQKLRLCTSERSTISKSLKP